LTLKKNTLNNQYYLEVQYQFLIEAISHELPFKRIPEEAKNPHFKILVYGQTNQKSWKIPYSMKQNESLLIDLSHLGELEDSNNDDDFDEDDFDDLDDLEYGLGLSTFGQVDN
jgi:hypothetical protein